MDSRKPRRSSRRGKWKATYRPRPLDVNCNLHSPAPDHQIPAPEASSSLPYLHDTGSPRNSNSGPGIRLENKSEQGDEDGRRGSDIYSAAADDDNIEVSGCTGDGDKVEDSKLGEDECVRRLFELKLSAEESELSEEQISVNRQLQEDELLALESIYGENISILDDQNGLKCFQAHVHVEIPTALLIIAQLQSDSQNQSEENTSDLSYSFHVSYLPPVILTCLLPRSYPSFSAPYFTISIQWLPPCKISELCGKLDSIWQEQTGQEVLYKWVEWLHAGSLSYLGFADNIFLGHYDAQYEGERRVISGCVTPDVDIPLLKNYNDQRQYEDFCGNIQECSICFSRFPGSEFIRLPCHHFFCEKCMETFSHMHMQEGTIFKLKCPQSKCDGTIPPGLLRRLLGREEYERWEALVLQRTLEAMSDVVNCPRCETACLEDEEHHAQCSRCFHSFCTLCLDRRHVGVSCMSPETKLQVLQERQRLASLGDEQRRRERDVINQLLSLKEISQFAKLCPSCNMAISRIDGCNKMVCDNCGRCFCYRCNQPISGYDHFRNGTCELFPKAEIQRWEAANPRRRAVGEMQALMFPDQGHRCPICGQQNLKVGNNNHIFCWACQTHYCYLCKKMVRRSSEHYGPKGCKQHTAG